MPIKLDGRFPCRWVIPPLLGFLSLVAGCMQDATHVSPLPPPSSAPSRIVVPAESRIEEGESFSVSVARTPREGVPIGMSVGAGQYFRVTMSGLVTIDRAPTESPLPCTSFYCQDLAVGKKVGPLGAMYYRRPSYFGFPSFRPQFFVVPPGRSLDSLTHNVYEAPIISLTGGSSDGVTDQVDLGSSAYLDIYTQSVVSAIARAPQTGELRILRRYVADLTTSGAQSVAVQPFTPLLLETRVSSSTGGTRFVARTSGTPHRVRWTFFEGDTLARSHQNIQRVVWVDACADQMVCDYVPARSGRMEVQLRITELETPQYATSDVVRAGAAAALKLTCTSSLGENRVTRGDTISCTASKDPVDAPGEIEVTAWRFSGGDYKYPDGEAGDEVPTGTTWGGEMAMSGTVTVTAKVNGTAASASAAVIVHERTEFKQKRIHVDIRPGTLADVPIEERPDDPPRRVSDLGRAMQATTVSGYEPKTNMAEVLRTVRFIQDEGPNHGLAYLKEIPMIATAIVVIHPALTRGSAFYQDQPQSSNVVHGRRPCVRSNWDEYVRLVEEHEGLRGNPNSHVGAFQAALNPAAAEAVEHVVGRVNALAAMADKWQELLSAVRERAVKQSSNVVFHETPGGTVRFGCEFNFDVRGR